MTPKQEQQLRNYNAIAENEWDVSKRGDKWNILKVEGQLGTGIGHGKTLDEAIENALQYEEAITS